MMVDVDLSPMCQETIWEAFKIFWDRLPEQEEYQSWMSQCQEGTVMARDIGSHFSQSKEHQDLVKQRMSHAGLKSEPTRSWQHMCSTPVPAAPEPVEAPVLEEVGKGMEDLVSSKVEESPLFNDITVQPTTATVLEQVVELSILLTAEMFSNELNNPASLKYQTLSRHLAEKIEDALQGLPGFKSVSVIDFRVDGIIVDYAVTVEVNGAGVSSEQLNYLTLQSNLVENSYHETEEHSTVVYTTSEVKKLFTEAFDINDIETVSEIPAPVSTADRATTSPVREADELTGKDEALRIRLALAIIIHCYSGAKTPVHHTTQSPEERLVI
ncbi:interphotoreceptor matrix proteoglycan 2-like [Melanotaenia boesemani]|uniref:interphotoreceptor matrix proteoglycan 2-like n=1 Tax=Melanotaenia boesemani TaxID=1250792 RepID=UPI001C055A60|nr:interphotoreceptor matrix proteoglycan 2-like [Melanotaenia boesemani]